MEDTLSKHRRALQPDELPQALERIRQSLNRDPADVAGWIECGILLRRSGEREKAETCFCQARALDPASVRALFNLGNLARERGDVTRAASLYQEACRLEPGNADVWNNLGLCFHAVNDLDAALRAYRRAASLQPRDARLYVNIGNALMEQNLPDDAVEAYASALKLDPAEAEAHHALALALLARGDFEQGWREFEWRLQCIDTGNRIGARTFPRPRWDGSPLEGRKLLVYAEQGLGDTIQFARFLPLPAQQGGRVIFACYPQLMDLCRTLEGVESLVDVTAGMLPDFDCYAALMSLPHLLGLATGEPTAAAPYLQPHATLSPAAVTRLHGSGLKVGLAWASNTKNRIAAARSIPFSALLPLASLAGVRWFSLQLGEAREVGPAMDAAFPLTGLLSEDDTMDATAALVEKLDLVITADTSIAHLAGALGKPVWTLLPFAADWRWLRRGTTTPWYPTMRLFRQGRRGDWVGVISQLCEELQRKATP